jgi:predicted alpha/beta superfamily hydrolase
MPLMSARILMVLTLVAPISLLAQPGPPQPVTIAAAERRGWKSAINGTEYQIDIALPAGYAMLNGKPNEKRYGVFYTLDGNVYFPLVTESLRMLRTNQLIPDDLIVIGIGYPSRFYAFGSQAYMASRGRDYTPKLNGSPERVRENQGQSPGEPGGASEFLRFLSEELVPWVDATYRTVAGDRTFAGHSFGGLFGGDVWKIREESGRLLIDAPGAANRTHELYAQSATSFATNLSNGAEFRLSFTLAATGGTAAELKLMRQPYLADGEFRTGRTLTLHRVQAQTK